MGATLRFPLCLAHASTHDDPFVQNRLPKAASVAPWSSEAKKLAHLDQAAELGGARADIVQPPHGIRKYGDKKVLVDPG